MESFTPEAYGDFKYVSKIADQFTRWTAVYLLENKSCAFDSFRRIATSTAIPCGGRAIRCVPTKEGNTRAERSSSIAWNLASPRRLRLPTHLSKTVCPSALAGPFAVWFAPSHRLSYSIDFGHSQLFSAFLGHLRVYLNINIY